MWVADCRRRINDDFVSDEQDGLGPGFVGLFAMGSRAFPSVEGNELGGDPVQFSEEYICEHDGGVRVSVGVNRGDFFRGDSGEEANGEGWAIAPDHARGYEGEVVVGIGCVDDGGEPDVGFALGDHLPDSSGNSLDKVAPCPGVEPFDECDCV